MQSVIHKADTRGHADHGWLDTHHTFSFAGYYNPERMHFGVLRVLNDDIIDGGTGFGKHPHDNMEIISIPLKGALEHQDSMGNTHVIKENDIQVMSAGTGVAHSEKNGGSGETNFLQIWVFPNKKNVEPRYDQKTFSPDQKKNKLLNVLSPDKSDDTVWIHQDAWFHLGNLEKGFSTSYSIQKEGNGAYFFILEGEVKIGDQILGKRDGIGIWETDSIDIEASQDAEVLVMDVPMHLN